MLISQTRIFRAPRRKADHYTTITVQTTQITPITFYKISSFLEHRAYLVNNVLGFMKITIDDGWL